MNKVLARATLSLSPFLSGLEMDLKSQENGKLGSVVFLLLIFDKCGQ